MVHLFEWKWNDIASECTDFLGPRGFAAVQVSPPNEHAVLSGQPWYQRYQPVSYKLESRSGSRTEFAAMVKICKAAGVDIYVDAVINHMTGLLPEGESRIGSAGSEYSRFNYLDFTYKDFHHCGPKGDGSIQNYHDRSEVQNCQLENLTDLDTESSSVQDKIAGYLSELLDLGVAGFRIDAAKHVPAKSVEEILSKVRGYPYIYQEVIDQGGEPIKASEYFPNGDVTEFRYSLDIGKIFSGGQLSWLNAAHSFGEEWGYLPTDKAIVFVDNHDNQRGHGGGGSVLTHKNPQLYQLASILMLAWPYGYPQIMSSYVFRTSNQGPPAHANGATKDVSCLAPDQAVSRADGWVCEHRWPAIANMVEFRNVTNTDFRITNWWTNNKNQIAFGRGHLGFVIINNEDVGLNQTLQTGMGAGVYCDVLTAENCKNTIVVESGGFAQFAMGPRSATAIHIGKKL